MSPTNILHPRLSHVNTPQRGSINNERSETSITTEHHAAVAHAVLKGYAEEPPCAWTFTKSKFASKRCKLKQALSSTGCAKLPRRQPHSDMLHISKQKHGHCKLKVPTRIHLQFGLAVDEENTGQTPLRIQSCLSALRPYTAVQSPNNSTRDTLALCCRIVIALWPLTHCLYETNTARKAPPAISEGLTNSL